MSGGCGQESFWPNFAPKKDEEEAQNEGEDPMAVATQQSQVFESASEVENEEEEEVPMKKPSMDKAALNDKTTPKKRLAAKDRATPKRRAAAKDRATPKRRAGKSKAAPKGRAKSKAKAKARSTSKRPAARTADTELDKSSVEEKEQRDKVDDESEELQELSGSDATATTLPLTPSAGNMEKRRHRPLPPDGEVEETFGCSKCRWSKRGCGKCRDAAAKPKAESQEKK